MRLDPIEHPHGIFLRLAYWLTKRRYGKVLSSLKVIYARKPSLAKLAHSVAKTMSSLSLDSELRLLVVVKTSELNGCPFCQDLYLAEAVKRRMGLERFRALSDYQSNPLFTDRERAALTATEEATMTRQLSDATFLQLGTYFSEEETVELIWLIAAENFFNIQAKAFDLQSDNLLQLITKP